MTGKVDCANDVDSILIELNSLVTKISEVNQSMIEGVESVGQNPEVKPIGRKSFLINLSSLNVSKSLDPFTYNWKSQQQFIRDMIEDSIGKPSSISNKLIGIIENRKLNEKGVNYLFSDEFVEKVKPYLVQAERLASALDKLINKPMMNKQNNERMRA